MRSGELVHQAREVAFLVTGVLAHVRTVKPCRIPLVRCEEGNGDLVYIRGEEDRVDRPLVVHGDKREEVLGHERHTAILLECVQEPMPAHAIKARSSMPALLLRVCIREWE
eukprot:1530338-Amphidinium_carterae.1